ncbi:MAG TPA: RNA polymerase sigma factor [Polyangiaceae bacterium]|nr:RNA polymerase sigma factor [Polyangiaceae bacterium]
MNTVEPAGPVLAVPDHGARVQAFVREHHAFTWRCLRRLGLAPADADDAAQRVFVIATARYAEIAAGSERAFLFRTAAHVAAKARRSAGRRQENLQADSSHERDDAPLADELIDQRRARELLDRVLGELPQDLAAVIILFEIEGLTSAEVALALDLRPGTVASRLRRARAEIESRVTRHLAKVRHQGAV